MLETMLGLDIRRSKMIGKNQLHFNQRQMQEIVQHYLETALLRPEMRVKVKEVKVNRDGSHTSDQFDVVIEAVEVSVKKDEVQKTKASVA